MKFEKRNKRMRIIAARMDAILRNSLGISEHNIFLIPLHVGKVFNFLANNTVKNRDTPIIRGDLHTQLANLATRQVAINFLHHT